MTKFNLLFQKIWYFLKQTAWVMLGLFIMAIGFIIAFKANDPGVGFLLGFVGMIIIGDVFFP